MTTTEAKTKTRAKAGAGSVRKRGETFTAIWSFPDPAVEGRRIQRSKGGFRIQKEAQLYVNEQIGKNGTDAAQGPDAKLTVRNVVEQWLEERALAGKRASTLAGYRNTAEAWIFPKMGAVRVDALTTSAVNAWMTELGKTGSKKGGPLSPRSVQLAGVVLRLACKWAADPHGVNLVRRNPAAAATIPAAPKTIVDNIWSREDAAKFISYVTVDRLAALYLLGAARGMRRGEICGLKWDRVDLDAGHLFVLETRIVVGGTSIQTSTPKTAAGQRRVPLDPSLVAVLRAHRRRQLEERLAWGSAWTDSGYVFTMPDGNPVKPDHVSDRFTRLCKAAGVRVIRLHDLRHGVASFMLGAGISPGIVAAVLGHANPAVTLSVYGHSLPGGTDVAGEALSRALGIC
ncbi:tyrosine-type recombinase/integrase [Nakamurella sp. PAMC28650]|uniref:tyrosine-type recombinase/integrase n=1 Tax=Nakamurella sp. PAMC28650 TaxID=2762325 RepID=UPI00164E221A|nr:tyrosine-type recombinase/integrase [Nakamurella sp. PAMC28650]QNK80412.1 tyrosine-type recombinase/integrase [Nakamurella sp. PAMC28650]